MNSTLYSIISMVIGAAFFVCMGFLLLATIPMVAPNDKGVDFDVLIESSRAVVLSFFGFLGSVVGLLKTRDLFASEVENEKSEVKDGVRADDATELRNKLKHAVNVANKRLESCRKTEAVAVNYYCYAILFRSALIAAVCFLASGGMEGLIYKITPPGDYVHEDGVPTSYKFYIIAFVQTELLLIAALIVPAYYYNSFLKRVVRRTGGTRKSYARRIGGLTFFSVGLISLLTLSPEEISSILTNADLREMRGLSLLGFPVNYFLYLAVFRLIVFPLLGIAGCYWVRQRWLRSSSKLPVSGQSDASPELRVGST